MSTTPLIILPAPGVSGGAYYFVPSTSKVKLPEFQSGTVLQISEIQGEYEIAGELLIID